MQSKCFDCKANTFSAADKLALKVENYDTLVVCTLVGESTVNVGRVDLHVEPVANPESRRVTIQDAKVVEKLNIKVTRPKDLPRWTHLRGLDIPKVDDEEVTLLIGANVPVVQVHEESRIGTAGEPYAVRTILGWAIFGPVKGTQQSKKVNVSFLRYVDETLDRRINQFLALDNAGTTRSDKKEMSIEDRRALKIMEDSICMVDGHYQVSILWNPWLPNNRPMAEARLRPVKRKLQKNKDLHRKYRGFIDKLEERRYARRLIEDEAVKQSSKTWYLPHHAVFHP